MNCLGLGVKRVKGQGHIIEITFSGFLVVVLVVVAAVTTSTFCKFRECSPACYKFNYDLALCGCRGCVNERLNYYQTRQFTPHCPVTRVRNLSA